MNDQPASEGHDVQSSFNGRVGPRAALSPPATIGAKQRRKKGANTPAFKLCGEEKRWQFMLSSSFPGFRLVK